MRIFIILIFLFLAISISTQTIDYFSNNPEWRQSSGQDDGAIVLNMRNMFII